MVFMYSEENFWLKKKVKVLLQVKKRKRKKEKEKRKKKKGKSETVRRMRKSHLCCGTDSVYFLRMKKKRAETQPLSLSITQ